MINDSEAESPSCSSTQGSGATKQSTFNSLKDYSRHFEQLLAQEIYAHVDKEIVESGLGTSFSCRVSGIVRKDEYWEVSAMVRTGGEQVLCLLFPACYCGGHDVL